MAGLNTRTGQRNAPSPYSAPASKVPIPRQTPQGGTQLERKEGFIQLKPKPGTSEISATLPKGKFDDLDAIRAREREDTEFNKGISNELQQNNAARAAQASYLDSERQKQAAAASNVASQELARMQGTVSNQINARDNQASITRQIIADDGALQRAKLQDTANLRGYYAENLKNLLGYGAARANQNYEYWR